MNEQIGKRIAHYFSWDAPPVPYNLAYKFIQSLHPRTQRIVELHLLGESFDKCGKQVGLSSSRAAQIFRLAIQNNLRHFRLEGDSWSISGEFSKNWNFWSAPIIAPSEKCWLEHYRNITSLIDTKQDAALSFLHGKSNGALAVEISEHLQILPKNTLLILSILADKDLIKRILPTSDAYTHPWYDRFFCMCGECGV